MGRVRERPRLLAAQVLAVLAVAGAGVLVGMALGGDEPTVPAASQERLERAERSAALNARGLEALRADAERARTVAGRGVRSRRALAARNRRLRSELRRTRRALARARR